MARNLHFAKCEDHGVGATNCQVASGQGVALGSSAHYLGVESSAEEGK